jgi:uncharacterized protein YndB with AHSA1/START domain
MTLKLTVVSETQAVVERKFSAPPELVYRAHVEPELIQKWLLGPPGWTMPVCINEARPGGKIRYEWVNGQGAGFFLTGEYIELVPNQRIEHVERMFLPDPTPDNRVVTSFERDGIGTRLTMTMTVPNAETLKAMLATGMTDGMEMSYQAFEALVASGQIL